jgi:hypothetical protein
MLTKLCEFIKNSITFLFEFFTFRSKPSEQVNNEDYDYYMIYDQKHLLV